MNRPLRYALSCAWVETYPGLVGTALFCYAVVRWLT